MQEISRYQEKIILKSKRNNFLKQLILYIFVLTFPKSEIAGVPEWPNGLDSN